MVKFFIFLFITCTNIFICCSQESGKLPWHGIERTTHYFPDGEDFVTTTGKRRFNRALYGGNSGFRAEAGDLPEFALYLPGMGGNLKFGLIKNGNSKWLIQAENITSRYRPGSMIYIIKDSLIGQGEIKVNVIALYDREALIVKLEGSNLPPDVKLLYAYGGATGTRFSRDGDIGADPESSFYLKPEYCKGNIYKIDKSRISLFFGAKSLSEEERYEIQYKPRTDSSKLPATLKLITGIFPELSTLKLVDAGKQSTPVELFQSVDSTTPAVAGQTELGNGPAYFFINNGESKDLSYNDLPALFEKNEAARKALAGRVKINTPDPYINNLGGALAVAADAIWDSPSFMHGAVAWRMRLNGWRGAYVADVLGWHNRAREHFSSYALSQVTSPVSAPIVMDTALNLARHAEKMGTALFSSGYISRNPGGEKRPHHYDMNLVFIDQLLHHFMWTGDTAYMRQQWPLLKRHLAWEKRNFDMDGDGLYDAYAAIWASDALQYSGGGVTHSSAYNYKANLLASRFATYIREDGSIYKKEADKILNAINKQLWLPSGGVYAEYKDLLGKKMQHPSPAIWTIYHAMDSYLPNPFQAYQSLKYIDARIPHIPIRSKGFPDTSLYTLATSNWQPYTWSLNNVVLGEVMHTALAYWQGGSKEKAFKLWKGSLMESMYLGASPGNFQQISFYDAVRGELYRDFADDIGMTVRATVEGLFGIFPDLLVDTLFIKPGLPEYWNDASISTPDIDFSFRRTALTDIYSVDTRFAEKASLSFQIDARKSAVSSISINGQAVKWKISLTAVGSPKLIVQAARNDKYVIRIVWADRDIEIPSVNPSYILDEKLTIKLKNTTLLDLYDPQKVLTRITKAKEQLSGIVSKGKGDHTFFLQVKQGEFTFWQPVDIKVEDLFTSSLNESDGLVLHNDISNDINGRLAVNYQPFTTPVSLSNKATTIAVDEIKDRILPGTNLVSLRTTEGMTSQKVINWNISLPTATKFDKIDISAFFNDKVSNIFSNKYLSPRPKGPTLQLPTQGIGNWAYALVKPIINDSGFRLKAGFANVYTIKQGIPFSTPSSAELKNIAFTSQWDNFPDSISIPVSGRSSHAYLLMAGSTNPMQSGIINGLVQVNYSDGSFEVLELTNPKNWWPIEQDFYVDGFAFTTGAPMPVRVDLYTGEDRTDFTKYSSLRGFSNRAIYGGAATVLDLPLDKSKTLKSLVLKSEANDVVIGLMSLTLVR